MNREEMMTCVNNMLECLPDKLEPSDLVAVMVGLASAFSETKEEVVEFTLAAHTMSFKFMLEANDFLMH